MILTGMTIRNRLAPNVSDEHRESLTVHYGEQFRVYLREMGVDPELLDIVDRNWASHHGTELRPAAWARFHIVTTPYKFTPLERQSSVVPAHAGTHLA